MEPYFSYSLTHDQKAEHQELYEDFLSDPSDFTWVDVGPFLRVSYENKPVFDLMKIRRAS